MAMPQDSMDRLDEKSQTKEYKKQTTNIYLTQLIKK